MTATVSRDRQRDMGAGWYAAHRKKKLLCLLRGVAFLLGLELGNLLLYGLIHTGLQFGAVAEHEKELKPDKERGQEDSLDQIIQKGRRTTLEGAMAEELEEPADDMNSKSYLVDGVRLGNPQVVNTSGAANTDSSENGACNRFQENIEAAPEEGCDCTQVQVKVGN